MTRCEYLKWWRNMRNRKQAEWSSMGPTGLAVDASMLAPKMRGNVADVIIMDNIQQSRIPDKERDRLLKNMNEFFKERASKVR